jgi:hypothetical protein
VVVKHVRTFNPGSTRHNRKINRSCFVVLSHPCHF